MKKIQRFRFLKKTCAVLLSAAAIGSSALASPALNASAADEVGVIPSRLYGVRIVDTDDYITAVRHTIQSTAAIREAEEAVKNDKDSVDLSESPYFPAVESQGGIGSCGAWANVYYQFTYEMNKSLDRPTTPENTFQPLFVYNQIVGGMNTGTVPWDIYELLHNNGCTTYANVPDTLNYATWNPDYSIWRDANNYRVSNYMYYENVGYKNSRIASPKDDDIAAIKATLRNGHIISFTGFILSYKTTTLKASPDGSKVNEGLVGQQVVYKQVGGDGCHAMTIVGYDDNIWTDINNNNKIDEGEMGAFKMVNSWGKDYCNKGFCWMAYDSLNDQSVVSGVGYEDGRHPSMITFVKLNVDKDFKSSNIYLKSTLNTSNRNDSYLAITAKRKKDGVTFTKKTAPHFQIVHNSAKILSYDGTTTPCDGTMIVDLDNVIPGLNSDTFNDYDWSVSFVDEGKDVSPLTVKDAVIIDENTQRNYALNTTFPFSVTKETKSVPMKDYYQFSKLSLTVPENAYVGSEVRFVAKSENETRGSSPIKYHLVISRDGKIVANKYTKGIAIDTVNKTNVLKIGWTPTVAGNYEAVLSATDESGIVASRHLSFKVYNKQLALRSIDTNTDRSTCRYERVVITPHVTGGTGKFTYSYYYEKGGKTYTILENTAKTSVSRLFGNTGAYKLIVKVKDSSGKAVQYSRYIKIEPTTISRINFSSDYIKYGTTIEVSAKVKYASSLLTYNDYTYTITKQGGAPLVVKPNASGAYKWTPKENGKYTVALEIKYKDKVLATKETEFEVGAVDVYSGMIKINVNVITYVYNEMPESKYQIRYWGGKDGAKDAVCTPLSTTTVKNVGFWGSAQTFKQYVAYIPKDATGFKFHIDNRWFPDGPNYGDGNTKTQNTVYAFNYDYDRVIYTKE